MHHRTKRRHDALRLAYFRAFVAVQVDNRSQLLSHPTRHILNPKVAPALAQGGEAESFALGLSAQLDCQTHLSQELLLQLWYRPSHPA